MDFLYVKILTTYIAETLNILRPRIRKRTKESLTLVQNAYKMPSN